jgi:hypothetical protein
MTSEWRAAFLGGCSTKITMHRHAICNWIVTAFDSSVEDPREYLRTEYGGFTLHIKPGHRDEVNLVSVFIEDPQMAGDVQLTINRFLSAMAWKDAEQFVTLGSTISGARLADKDNPRFNYSEGRVLRYRVINEFDFEHLQNPPDQKQKLALALYREGQNSNLPLYRLLSYYKIINIGFQDPKDQMAWINDNLGKVHDEFGKRRRDHLSTTIPDIGNYLYVQGRTSIAHAYSDPIKDPDVPVDVLTAIQDAELMQSLARVFIEDELGVLSLRKIHNEHLYELAGFKQIFGAALTARLKAGDNIPVADFPPIPPLTIRQRVHLQDGLQYDCLTALPFQVVSCIAGVVVLQADSNMQPIKACLVLAFPAERLDFILERFGISGNLKTKAVEICWYQFLIHYFHNGYLRIFDAVTNERLSHKLAFIPVNIDPGATVEGWQRRIAELQALPE